MIRLIQQLGQKHDTLRVLQDFVEIATCSLCYPQREARYFAIRSRYTDDEMWQFHQLGQMLLNELEQHPRDVLGDLYMKLQLANKQKGQCFTPDSLAKLMSEFAITNAEHEIKQKGYYTLYEPTCGSGALIINFCETLKSHGHNPQMRLLVKASDIDLKAVQMCFVQLSLLGIPALIQHADPLNQTVFEQYTTLFYRLRGFQ